MPEEIIIIDAYAQIYRGYYAVRQLSNSSGQPTNAVFALAKFLLKMHRSYPGNLGVFAFDLGKPSFRMDIAPDYKANRSPMPDDMRSQLPFIHRLIKAFGWPELSLEGYEADDIIAAITEKFTENPVKIVSSDKDLAQLIDDRVQMLIPDRKGGGFTVRGPVEVEEKFCVRPDQVIDYLSLIGDSSDNIPGLPGVGAKTAAKLINEFGSLEAIIEKADDIKNEKLREKVKENVDLLRKNVDLISLKSDIPGLDLSSAGSINRTEPDWGELSAIVDELELNSIRRELEEAGSFLPPETPSEPPASSEISPKEDKTEDEGYIPDLFSGL